MSRELLCVYASILFLLWDGLEHEYVSRRIRLFLPQLCMRTDSRLPLNLKHPNKHPTGSMLGKLGTSKCGDAQVTDAQAVRAQGCPEGSGSALAAPPAGCRPESSAPVKSASGEDAENAWDYGE